MAISTKLLNPGENIVISTRTHVKSLIVPILVLVVLLAIGVFVQVKDWNDKLTLGVWIVVALLVLWYVVRPVLDWFASTYTVTTRRLITRHGILTRRGHDIPLSRISDVAYERDILDRMLGCGTLVISDASTNGQVLLYDIPHVEAAQRQLNELLHSLHAGENRSHEGF